MKQPHKHADIIKAWADGAEIEYLAMGHEWKPIGENPQWFENSRFRIKPEPKPDVVKFGCFYAYANSEWQELRIYDVQQRNLYPNTAQLKLIFDGETGKLKSAEVL